VFRGSTLPLWAGSIPTSPRPSGNPVRGFKKPGGGGVRSGALPDPPRPALGQVYGQQSGRSRAINYRLPGELTMTAATDLTFHDDRPKTWAYEDPEYAVVP